VLERHNDQEVLQFLGCATDRLAGIRNSRPEPSFMIVRLKRGVMAGEWHGILETLDERGQFSGVRQPEDAAVGLYTFTRVR
jgi:hypothetical protein